MAEMRLIDANALNTSVALYMAENAYLNDTPLDILKMVSRWIAEAPTIDAVPVVRCEHCKETIECQLYGEHCGLPAERGIFCEVWQTVVDKTGYCYQGAKMDGGASDGSDA